MRRPLAAVLGLLVGVGSAASSGEKHGHFEGNVEAKWLDDGRQMELTKPFVYVAPDGSRWEAPKGSIVDGASIPPRIWSLIGGPYEGKYRDASVIHDVACKKKNQPWQIVHRTFYSGMLARGTPANLAKTMYGAVYKFGPRWDRVASEVVHQSQVFKKRGEFVAEAMKGDNVDVRTRVIIQGVFSDSKTLVSAKYRPEAEIFTESDFERLKTAINAKSLTLEEIEDFPHEPDARGTANP